MHMKNQGYFLIFQSTPLREGRRYSFDCNTLYFDFSIHAPARGATNCSISCLRCFAISIHAPARGATVLDVEKQVLEITFQSTPLREGRLSNLKNDIKESRISIHAPARGATGISCVNIRGKDNFNPRPCARGDPRYKEQRGIPVISIHAPARGATRQY